MNFRRLIFPLTLASLTAGLPALLARADSVPADANRDREATQKTIKDIRAVGTAMWVWYKDEVAPKRSGEAHKKAEEAAKSESADLAAVPVISREELTRLLVPRYIAAIPEKDGWGHPYEFHLVTNDPNAVNVMGLRSAGRDGRFSGDVYRIGAFSPNDFDEDIPWMDGYFVRWPEAK